MYLQSLLSSLQSSQCTEYPKAIGPFEVWTYLQLCFLSPGLSHLPPAKLDSDSDLVAPDSVRLGFLSKITGV